MATTGEQKVEIWCGVLGDGSMFPVEIARNATAHGLRQEVAKIMNGDARVHVAAYRLKLFMPEDPQVGDVRLHGGLKLRPFLKDGQVPETGFKEMDPLCGLDADECFGSAFPTKEGELHVLVKLPDGSLGRDSLTLTQTIQLAYEVLRAKRRRTAGNFRGVTNTPALIDTPALTESVELGSQPAVQDQNDVATAAALLDKLFAPIESGATPESVDLGPPPAIHNDHYWTLPAALLDKCRLAVPHADTVMMYCRREVRDLWAFVEEQVVAMDASGSIVGPPGTGKSLSTLCYLTRLDPREWNVVWIHLGDRRDSCLSMGSREYWKDIDLETFVVPRVDGKRLFVCLDGFKKTDEHRKFLRKVLIRLTTGDRHLVCASVATLGKVNQEDAEVERHRTFFMPSWTRDDYEAAVADPAFYEQVASKLDATSANEVNVDGAEVDWSEAEKKKHALDLKFYYAGGSCRFMFQRTTDEVKQRLDDAVESTQNKTDLIKYCSGSYHNDTINTLYGMAGGGRTRFPVSSYAVSLFAKETGVDSIAQLASRLNTSNNPAVDGHLMEWLFLASVPKRVVKLFRDDNVTYELPRAPVLAFDPKKAFDQSDGRIKGNKSWLQPVAWNQGGYDAVYFDQDKGDVMFIQVTRSKRHSFKMRFFYEVLWKLKEANMAIKTVDVYFVVKSTQCLQFEIGPIDDRDHLVMFDEKWTQPEEKHVKVGAFEAVGLQ